MGDVQDLPCKMTLKIGKIAMNTTRASFVFCVLSRGRSRPSRGRHPGENHSVKALKAGDLAENLGVSETSLRHTFEYRMALKDSMQALGIRFRKGSNCMEGIYFRDTLDGTTDSKTKLVSVPKDISSGTDTNIGANLINPLPLTNSYLDAVCDQVGLGLQTFFSSRFKMAPATAPKALRTDFEVDEALTA